MLKVNQIIKTHVLDGLKKLPNECIDMVVTSPPYWNLRDYGKTTETIWDADPKCRHQFGTKIPKKRTGGTKTAKVSQHKKGIGHYDVSSQFCQKCGAWKGQLGLEPDFYLYIKHLLTVFAEIKRVLKKTGTCFVNFGDTYGGKSIISPNKTHSKGATSILPDDLSFMPKSYHIRGKWDKCLLGLPERFMIGMMEQGWTLRNKIIWHKRNHIPSSVKDRFANAWEYVYMFSKSSKYYFDLDAVRVPHKRGTPAAERCYQQMMQGRQELESKPKDKFLQKSFIAGHPLGKNPDDLIQTDDIWEIILKERAKQGGLQKQTYTKYLAWKKKNPDRTYDDFYQQVKSNKYISTYAGKSKYSGKIESCFGNYADYLSLPHPKGLTPADYWFIATQPMKEAHFAVFPEKLIERPIMAGCPGKVCQKCGMPNLSRHDGSNGDAFNIRVRDTKAKNCKHIDRKATAKEITGYSEKNYVTKCQKKAVFGCNCNAGFKPGIVLDPFMGSGTTAVVAKRLGRNYLGFELNPDYIKIAQKRLQKVNV